MKESNEDIIQKYSYQRHEYQSLCDVLRIIIENLLRDAKIDFLYVSARSKSIDSFASKIKRKNYSDPFKEMTDLAGIRIVNYIEADVIKASELIEKTFNIHKDMSGNKRDSLGHDKIGYQSIHFVCDLGKHREELPEYSKYRGKLFEVQVRTILQHAWAEIEHDRNYKFSGILPSDIQRRFYLIAGQLEIADREFNSIAIDIDEYKSTVIEKTKQGNFDIEIDSTSLIEFIKQCINKFRPGKVVINNSPDIKSINTLVQEIIDFGISKLSQLYELLTDDFIEQYNKLISNTNENGFIRDILIYADIDKYFKYSWNSHWAGIEDNSTKHLITKKYGKHKIYEIERIYGSDIFNVLLGDLEME